MESETKVVSINHWNSCPFRGVPKTVLDTKTFLPLDLVVRLDYRCPSSVRSIVDLVDTGFREEAPVFSDAPRKRGRPKKGEERVIVETKPVEIIEHFVPILEEGTYCEECLSKRVREREMGISFTERNRPMIAEKKGRGRPRKVR